VSWRAAGPADMERLVAFLCRDEASCTGASARVKSDERGSQAFVEEAGGVIRGAIVATPAGMVLPVLPEGPIDRPSLAQLLGDLHAAVQSIGGPPAAVDAIESAMPVAATTRIEYRLMKLERTAWAGPGVHASAAAAIEGVRVRRSTASDVALLFPLQRAYELEEVVLDRALFSDAGCLKLLRHGLREQLVFHAFREGRPLAKAGTNARGYAVDQIGGVFTVASERGKGLARIVMAALLEAIFAEKSGACLFVKHANAPAIALYERLGFTSAGGYAISYYGI
jgi:GNAT superfamily N-acetyltransferase